MRLLRRGLPCVQPVGAGLMTVAGEYLYWLTPGDPWDLPAICARTSTRILPAVIGPPFPPWFTRVAWQDSFRTFEWEKAVPVPEMTIKQIGELLQLTT